VRCNAGGARNATRVFCGAKVKRYDITGEDTFLVIGCDGIWDVLSDQQVRYSRVLVGAHGAFTGTNMGAHMHAKGS
jgi:hypothetical protein